jgi:hypothetical protein
MQIFFFFQFGKRIKPIVRNGIMLTICTLEDTFFFTSKLFEKYDQREYYRYISEPVHSLYIVCA